MGSMPQETVKILVLETDEPHPETQNEHGSFGDIFINLFTTAGQRHDPPLGVELDKHFVVEDPEHDKNGHVPTVEEIPKDVKAILITGSLYDAHGDDEWIQKLRTLVRELWTKRPEVCFSGVCFGHQLLARTLGAKVEPTPGKKWELSHTSMSLTKVGQKLFLTNDSTLSVHQMHQDQVTTIPSSETTDLLTPETKVHVWASTDHTEIQGLYIRDRLFSSQGHLGFNQHMVKRQIELRQKTGAIKEKDQKDVEEAEEKAHLEHDGEVVAAAIVRFFHGDDHDID